MFDQLHSSESQIHFTVMRWELEERPSPAWDFIWIVKNPTDGQRARLRGRLVFKPFVSAQDIQDEYNTWQSTPE
jgi:hypothetical protein